MKSTIFSNWTMSELGIYISQDFYWGLKDKKDIELSLHISVEEAFFGKEVNLGVERLLISEDCTRETCQHCGGKGWIDSHNHSGSIYKTLRSPCYVCLGTGWQLPKFCNPFYIRKEEVTFHIPKGCTRNYQVVIEGKGHEYFLDRRKHVGNLDILVDKIGSDNLTVSDHVEMVVVLSPFQVVEGFETDFPYIMNKTLHINRMNKITLPGSSVFIKGLGLPPIEKKVTGVAKTSDAQKHHGNDDQEQNGDLEIKFELEPEPTEEESAKAEMQLLKETVTLLSSQKDLDRYVSAINRRSKEKTMRDLIKMLLKFDDIS